MGGFDLAMATAPATSVNVHHVIQQAVTTDNAFFKLLDSNWENLTANKLVLTSNSAVASASGTPLHPVGFGVKWGLVIASAPCMNATIAANDNFEVSRKAA